VTIEMVRNRLAEPDALEGFLLDGFPRTVPQAEVLDDILLDTAQTRLDVVLELVVDDDEVIRRLSGRRTCRSCNHIWHVDFDPPKVDGVCDIDGGELYQREDDKPRRSPTGSRSTPSRRRRWSPSTPAAACSSASTPPARSTTSRSGPSTRCARSSRAADPRPSDAAPR
jgi:hypothetical protein